MRLPRLRRKEEALPSELAWICGVSPVRKAGPFTVLAHWWVYVEGVGECGGLEFGMRRGFKAAHGAVREAYEALMQERVSQFSEQDMSLGDRLRRQGFID